MAGFIPLLVAALQVPTPGAPGLPGIWDPLTLAPDSSGQFAFFSSGVWEPDGLVTDDLDGDGYLDVVVTDTWKLYAYSGNDPLELIACSGRDGAVQWRTRLGTAVSVRGIPIAQLADIDGDGTRDLLVGAPGAPAASQVYGTFYGAAHLLSGADGGLIRRHHATVYREYLGFSVAGCDDLDGDGVGDYLVGGIQESQILTATTGRGWVRAYSGATGAELYVVRGTSLYFGNFGWAIQMVDDVDLDGLRDFVVGDPGHDGVPSYDNRGRVSLHSAADGSVIREWTGAAGESLGRHLAWIEDLDGDGCADILTTRADAPWDDRAVVVLGSASSLPLAVITRRQDESFADDLTTIPDLTGDGRRELVVTSPDAPAPAAGYRTGRVEILDGRSGDIIASFSTEEHPGPGNYLRCGTGAGHARRDPASGDVYMLLPFPLGEERRFHLLRPRKGIRLSASGVSAATLPALVDVELDFPDSEAGRGYLVLASSRRSPSTTVLGLEVPLAATPLLARVMLGAVGPQAGAMNGTLDAAGDAATTLLIPHAAAAYVGTTIHFCALSRVGLDGRAATAAVSLEILP